MNSLAQLADVLAEYHGLIIGFAVLAGVVALNQVIWRRRCHSYPTREQYLRAYPACDTATGATCKTCGGRALKGKVFGAGNIYRCGWCDTELYRVD